MPAKQAARKGEPAHALRIPDQRKNSPEIRAVFARCLEKIGFVPNVLRSYTLRPRNHGKFVLIFVADSRHAIMVRPLSLGSLRGLGNGFGRHGAAV